MASLITHRIIGRGDGAITPSTIQDDGQDVLGVKHRQISHGLAGVQKINNESPKDPWLVPRKEPIGLKKEESCACCWWKQTTRRRGAANTG